MRATSLERLLDQHKVCRNSLLVGAQGGEVDAAKFNPERRGKVATVISLVFFLLFFLSWPFLGGLSLKF